ncbi:MAG TPA: iron ABC transporter substrate-binding protein [Rhodospirillales bacterium]|nr:iron ABC transporter substrate-binding protein [Rhodospirillales bacterium]
MSCDPRLSRRRFALAVATCAAAPSLVRAGAPLAVTDVVGRRVELPGTATRIVLGFYFEDFMAVGGAAAFDRVVGISREAWEGWRNSQWKAYTAVLPHIAELPDVGEVDAGTFSVEKVLSLRPDLVLLAEWQYRGLATAVARLEAAGVPVVVLDYNAQTVEKHVLSTRILGDLLGERTRAEELADTYAAAVAEVVRRVARSDGRPRVYVELGNRGALETGNSYGDIMWGRLVEIGGGTNIAEGKVSRWGPLNPEYVLAADPEAIFIAGSYWTNREQAVLMGFGVDPDVTRQRLAPYLQRPGWRRLAAVREGRVHALYHGGARTLHDYTYLQYIAKVLHPEAFADIEPLEALRRHYRKWLPIRADGAFMVPFFTT